MSGGIELEIIDLHCDALYKIWQSNGRLDFKDAKELDTNLKRLQQGNVKGQCFAIFIEPDLKTEEKFQAVLDQITIFYNLLHQYPQIKQMKSWEDFDDLTDGEIGAMLTLEGVDAIGNDLNKLMILYELGVRSVGLTWNETNLAADGVGEPRGAGLTSFGRDIVQWNNKNHVLTDVSHLSEQAFWDVIELADYPLASHSNAKAVHDHRRNLTDKQIQALFMKNGMIHVVFYPPFIANKREVTIADVIKHIDHLCSLGGEKQIGFGSDFDGIDEHVMGLENAMKFPHLINELLKYYSEEQVKGFAFQNFLNNRPLTRGKKKK